MKDLYPKDDPQRLRRLTDALACSYEALSEQADFTPDEMLLAAANAAARYAVNNGIDPVSYGHWQDAIFLELIARKIAQKGAPS
jgi:hypothetical protein